MEDILKRAYRLQKSATKGRVDKNGNEIEFRLTYEQWLDIWQQSGQLHNRGRHKGSYVMGRNNDLGHYEVGNVAIISRAQNQSDVDWNNTNLRKQCKRVQTPEGVFRSLSQAAKHHGLSTRGLILRIGKQEGYEYLPN